MDDEQKREIAVRRVKERRDFYWHLGTYLIVNAFLIAVWAWSDASYFWPFWVLVGWGIGLAFHAWATFFGRPVDEGDIQKEMRKLE